MLGTLSIFLRPPIQVFFFFLHSLFLQLSNSSYCKLVFVIISIDIILFYLPSVLGSCSACVFMFYLGLKRVRQRGMLICLWGRILRRCFPVTCCKRISWLGGTCCQFASIFFFMTHHANRLQCIVCESRPACLLAYMCCSYQCGTCGCSEQPGCHLGWIKVVHIYIVKVFNCFISDAGMVFNLDHSMVRCLLPVLHLIISGSL